MQAPPRKAILIGEGITVLGTLRCLADSGLDLRCLSARPGIEKFSRYYKPALPPGVPGLRNTRCENLKEALLAFLKLQAPGGLTPETSGERYLLFACSDHALHAVSSLSPEIKKSFPSMQLDRDTLAMFTDKDAFRELLGRTGIPHPHSTAITKRADLAAVPDDVLRRGFLKPRDSQSFYSAFRVKAFRYQSREEALSLFEKTEDAGLKVLLQEYVPGPPSNHIYVEGVVDHQGGIHGLFARRRLRMHPPDFGNSTAMISIPLAEVPQPVADMKKLLAAVPFRGIFSAEWKLDSSEGVYKIIEVNCRPHWFIGVLEQCGVNLPRILLEQLKEGVPVQRSRNLEYKTGLTFVYPYYDFHALHREFGPWLALLKAAQHWLGVRYVVFSCADPYPALRGAALGTWRFLASRLSARPPNITAGEETPLAAGASPILSKEK